MMSPAMFAYVPDPKHPSTWKLPIPDARHVGLAIAALGSNPPHGQGVQIPAKDHPMVISKLRHRIGELKIADADKQALLKRLNAL